LRDGFNKTKIEARLGVVIELRDGDMVLAWARVELRLFLALLVREGDGTESAHSVP
jgi:hypothetical protein